MDVINWPNEFAKIISCKLCNVAYERNLLRDDLENVPQPGYIGKNYYRSRILLVGQNPGTPKSLEAADRPYTASLRNLRDVVSVESYTALNGVMRNFIPQWPVHGNYFPLTECGLTLDEIAYMNVVRCRTSADKKPGTNAINNCLSNHFGRWLDLLSPRVIVFIGKWAADNASHEAEKRKISFAFMNRQRSLSTAERIENRQQVVDLVRSVFGEIKA